MDGGYLPIPRGFNTAICHEVENYGELKSIVPPLISSTTYELQLEEPSNNKYWYSRTGNLNRDILENLLAKLDNGKYGLCFSSGIGAITAMVNLLSSGDHILLGEAVYGGTNKLMTKLMTKMNIKCDIFDIHKLEELEQKATKTTKMIWIESPTNPLSQVVDIKAVAQISKKLNALLVVDNTYLTPYFQRPLDLGADVALYSVSKYINGHADVVMGAITTNNDNIYKELKIIQQSYGIIPAPFDCYQVNRSLKTLPLRMDRHSKNALVIAKFLEKHAKVEKVLYPGLPSHPQYELSKKQTSGVGGMIPFYIKGGLEESKKFLSSIKVVIMCGSLGNYHSCASLPNIMSHFSVNEDIKEKLGITNNLIRLSVGLEDVEDLIEDLDQALSKI